MNFTEEYLKELLCNLERGDNAQTAIKNCGACHFRANKMEEILTPLKGDLQALLSFLAREWGWIIERDGRRILIDENKSECVCPLAQGGAPSAILCNCSEGFAERTFSFVLGRPVKAKVIASVLRGDKSCRYEILE